jgi:IS30 family transposase
MDYILLRKLAAQIGRHHTAVRADLRRRGYEIREIRTVANQWAHALARRDADKWLRERELEMTVTRRVAS